MYTYDWSQCLADSKSFMLNRFKKLTQMKCWVYGTQHS